MRVGRITPAERGKGKGAADKRQIKISPPSPLYIHPPIFIPDAIFCEDVRSLRDVTSSSSAQILISLDGRFSALAFIRVLAALDFSNDCPAQKKSITRCRTGGPDIGEAKTVKSSYEGSLVGWDWNWILRGKKHHPFCLDGGRPPPQLLAVTSLSLSLSHSHLLSSSFFTSSLHDVPHLSLLILSCFYNIHPLEAT